MTISLDTLRAHIVRLVLDSAEGDLTEADLAAVGWSLPDVSYSSLSAIRLLDAVENEFGVYLDAEDDADRITTVDGIVALVRQRLGEDGR